jgi:hypothetical protein
MSFEEFLELFQGSLPTASIASFVATIFIAVAAGAFGAVLTYAVDPGSKWVASAFCWMSLGLVCGGVLGFNCPNSQAEGTRCSGTSNRV